MADLFDLDNYYSPPAYQYEEEDLDYVLPCTNADREDILNLFHHDTLLLIDHDCFYYTSSQIAEVLERGANSTKKILDLMVAEGLLSAVGSSGYRLPVDYHEVILTTLNKSKKMLTSWDLAQVVNLPIFDVCGFLADLQNQNKIRKLGLYYSSDIPPSKNQDIPCSIVQKDYTTGYEQSDRKNQDIPCSIVQTNSNNLCNCKDHRRKKGEGTGYIIERLLKGKFKQYYFGYEIYSGGACSKKSKYIPAGKFSEVKKMNDERLPVSSILDFLNLKNDRE